MEGQRGKLLGPDEAGRFRERWHEVQAGFVDDPSASVREADDLASDAVEALGRVLTAQRRTLAEGLEQGNGADTERLRQTLRDYRELLNRVIDA
ncbi:hypothetical protein D0T12_27035 [Actinomadura spongiicola]|uniref:Uncharacterized protein n=1 Tax=Actinomadura spongiicola TaxID=2303421 RepID=A0A372GAN0_9ACTN|nr:hypothetical protein [Actinomadura spongiicola]RFS82456.1 hypothetical protein D0T12_27035 [Actinomadura spongiicola]